MAEARPRSNRHVIGATNLSLVQPKMSSVRLVAVVIRATGVTTPCNRTVLLEATRLAGRYPVNRMDVMPTVLGNILRRHERIVGYPYGLKMAVVALICSSSAPQRMWGTSVTSGLSWIWQPACVRRAPCSLSPGLDCSSHVAGGCCSPSCRTPWPTSTTVVPVRSPRSTGRPLRR